MRWDSVKAMGGRLSLSQPWTGSRRTTTTRQRACQRSVLLPHVHGAAAAAAAPPPPPLLRPSSPRRTTRPWARARGPRRTKGRRSRAGSRAGRGWRTSEQGARRGRSSALLLRGVYHTAVAAEAAAHASSFSPPHLARLHLGVVVVVVTTKVPGAPRAVGARGVEVAPHRLAAHAKAARAPAVLLLRAAAPHCCCCCCRPTTTTAACCCDGHRVDLPTSGKGARTRGARQAAARASHAHRWGQGWQETPSRTLRRRRPPAQRGCRELR